MVKTCILPFGVGIAVAGGIVNIFAMFMPQPFGTILSFAIGWFVYLLVYNRKTGWEKKYLLMVAFIMVFVTYIGVITVCANSSQTICQRNLLVVSSFSAVIPFWAWLLLVLLNLYGLFAKNKK